MMSNEENDFKSIFPSCQHVRFHQQTSLWDQYKFPILSYGGCFPIDVIRSVVPQSKTSSTTIGCFPTDLQKRQSRRSDRFPNHDSNPTRSRLARGIQKILDEMRISANQLRYYVSQHNAICFASIVDVDAALTTPSTSKIFVHTLTRY